MQRTSLILRSSILSISLAVLVATQHASHAADGGWLKKVTSIAKSQAVEYLDGKQFKVNDAGFQGTLSAIDPAKHVSVSVRDFRLANDNITAKVTLRGRFRMEGKITLKGKAMRITCDVDTTTTVTGEAALVQENGEFFVRPQVKGLDVKHEVLKVSSGNAPGTKEALLKAAQVAFEKRRKKIIASVNEQLAAAKLEF